MFSASAVTLKWLSALVWYSGFIVLYIKSTHLFIEVERINPDQGWTWLAILAGFLIGVIKAKYLYQQLCLKNLKRIESLNQPRIWQFYRFRFYMFLFSMIALGLFLSKQIHDHYIMLITLATIELSIATALLGSCHCFWKKNTSD
ncbi:MAG: hypothetical protein OEY87_00885 [Gammaproteobacteria bacterium]|nr:hypothetical protein [Gammaproteobacteria bacterium]